MSDTSSKRGQPPIISPIKQIKTLKSTPELQSIKDNIAIKSKYYLKDCESPLKKMALDDFYEDTTLLWCNKHALKVPFQSSLTEKRKLRQWFSTFDEDGGGTVSLKELINPLMSTGMFHSVEAVTRLLNSIDDDKSGEISFEEFYQAIAGKKVLCRDQVRTLGEMSEDKNGFSVKMLLSVERRRNLMNTVMTQASTRLDEMDDVLNSKSSKAASINDNNVPTYDAALKVLLAEHHDQRKIATRYLEGLQDIVDEESQLMAAHERSQSSSRAYQGTHLQNDKSYKARESVAIRKSNTHSTLPLLTTPKIMKSLNKSQSKSSSKLLVASELNASNVSVLPPLKGSLSFKTNLNQSRTPIPSLLSADPGTSKTSRLVRYVKHIAPI